jgi:hypothetical protein
MQNADEAVENSHQSGVLKPFFSPGHVIRFLVRSVGILPFWFHSACDHIAFALR